MLPPRITAAALCGAAILGLASPLRAADDRLQRVIDNVRANEALYQNIEAHVTESYKMLDPMGNQDPNVIKSSTKGARSVRQGQFLYYNRDETMELADGSTRPHNCLMGYDGEYTRRLEGKTANLVHGPYGPCQLFRPHAWLLGKPRVCFPLSVWLTGGKELENQQGAGSYKDYWLQKVFYEQEEEVDGLHTVKLRAEQALMEEPSTLASFGYLWLATDRNYLPVKLEGFNPHWSKALPVEVDRVTDFREIAPGVWLPFQRSSVIYFDMKLAENKLVVANTEEATLTKVDLNPHYDISLFRDIPIPDGTLVYEVKDDQIINKYTQGEQTNPHWPPPRPFPWHWLVAPAVGLILVGGWFGYRWWSRKRARAPAAA